MVQKAGIRPVVIVQRNTIDRFTQTVVVIPITGNQRRSRIPGTITIPSGNGGLLQDSVALCYQIVAIDKQRLTRKLGTLSSEYLLKLKEALKYTLQLDELEDDTAPPTE